MGTHGSSVSYAMPQRTFLSWPVASRPVWGLCLLFLSSLPVVNPYVHGDGVGYYAYARALLIQGDLRFEQDWRRANEGFSKARMALGTACCGFLGLLLSFGLVRQYVAERWAFLATLGVWTAASLPVYMYFN